MFIPDADPGKNVHADPDSDPGVNFTADPDSGSTALNRCEKAPF